MIATGVQDRGEGSDCMLASRLSLVAPLYREVARLQGEFSVNFQILFLRTPSAPWRDEKSSRHGTGDASRGASTDSSPPHAVPGVCDPFAPKPGHPAARR